MSKDVEIMWFEASCPFMFCLALGRHGHPKCPDCGAVRYGNFYCRTCREKRGQDSNPVVYPDEKEEVIDG